METTIIAKRYEANPHWMPAGRHWAITLQHNDGQRITRVVMASEDASQALWHVLWQAKARGLSPEPTPTPGAPLAAPTICPVHAICNITVEHTHCALTTCDAIIPPWQPFCLDHMPDPQTPAAREAAPPIATVCPECGTRGQVLPDPYGLIRPELQCAACPTCTRVYRVQTHPAPEPELPTYNPEDGAPCAQCGHGQDLHYEGVGECWESSDTTPPVGCPCPQFQAREAAQRADEAELAQQWSDNYARAIVTASLAGQIGYRATGPMDYHVPGPFDREAHEHGCRFCHRLRFAPECEWAEAHRACYEDCQPSCQDDAEPARADEAELPRYTCSMCYGPSTRAPQVGPCDACTWHPPLDTVHRPDPHYLTPCRCPACDPAAHAEEARLNYYARETERQNALCMCAHPVYTHYKRGQGCTRCKCKQLVYDCRPPADYVPPARAAEGTPEGDAARWLANRGLAPMAGGSELPPVDSVRTNDGCCRHCGQYGRRRLYWDPGDSATVTRPFCSVACYRCSEGIRDCRAHPGHQMAITELAARGLAPIMGGAPTPADDPAGPGATHTPGPWAFGPYGAIGYDVIGGSQSVAIMNRCAEHYNRALAKNPRRQEPGTPQPYPATPEALANARLIAAAPALLEACHEAAEYISRACGTDGTPALGVLRAALAQATLPPMAGGSDAPHCPDCGDSGAARDCEPCVLAPRPPMAGGAPSHYDDPAWYADEAWHLQEERNAESAQEDAEEEHTHFCPTCRHDRSCACATFPPGTPLECANCSNCRGW